MTPAARLLGGIRPQTVEVTLTGVDAATKKSVVLGQGTKTTPADVMLRAANSVDAFEFSIAVWARPTGPWS